MMDEKYMFKNQKKCYGLISKDHSLIEVLISEYDDISNLHGSGKDYIGKNHIYDEFMETKWCMVYDKMIKYNSK